MIKISVREFTHHLAEYIRRAEKGEKIIITKRNKPAVELSYYNEHVDIPSWKRPFEAVKIKGESIADTVRNLRDTE